MKRLIDSRFNLNCDKYQIIIRILKLLTDSQYSGSILSFYIIIADVVKKVITLCILYKKMQNFIISSRIIHLLIILIQLKYYQNYVRNPFTN